MQEEIIDTITEINSTERYSEENKSAWRSLFQLAKNHAYKLKTKSKYSKDSITRDVDETMVSILVDQWMAEYHNHYQSHSSPQDDRQAGDISCVQAMEQAAKDDAITAIKELFSTNPKPEFKAAVRKRLGDQIAGSSPRLAEFLKHASDQWLADNASEIVNRAIKYTNCDITAYISYGQSANERSNLRFSEYESLESADQSAITQEYTESFYQDPECDPDDARFLGTAPRTDEWEDKMRSNQVDRKRGSGGVLNGLYQNSKPEPTYYTKEKRNRLRMSYLDSDNVCDIMVGAYMKRMDPMRRNRLINNRIQENINA